MLCGVLHLSTWVSSPYNQWRLSFPQKLWQVVTERQHIEEHDCPDAKASGFGDPAMLSHGIYHNDIE
jgi:hypothetical protein